MSAEKIIGQIQKDAEKEIQQIQNEAEQRIKKIKEQAEKLAKQKADEIKKEGIKKGEIIEKIRVSKANQESKKKIMQVKEEIINQCFKQASEELKELDEDTYKKIVRRLLKETKNKLGNDCKIKTSGDLDQQLAEELNIKVFGNIKSDGGIIAYSSNEKISLDLTFERILKREKDKLRIKIGGLLFS